MSLQMRKLGLLGMMGALLITTACSGGENRGATTTPEPAPVKEPAAAEPVAKEGTGPLTK